MTFFCICVLWKYFIVEHNAESFKFSVDVVFLVSSFIHRQNVFTESGTRPIVLVSFLHHTLSFIRSIATGNRSNIYCAAVGTNFGPELSISFSI